MNWLGGGAARRLNREQFAQEPQSASLNRLLGIDAAASAAQGPGPFGEGRIDQESAEPFPGNSGSFGKLPGNSRHVFPNIASGLLAAEGTLLYPHWGGVSVQSLSYQVGTGGSGKNVQLRRNRHITSSSDQAVDNARIEGRSINLTSVILACIQKLSFAGSYMQVSSDCTS